MAAQRYLIALGSNVRHPRFGRPELVLRAALGAMAEAGLGVERVSRVIRSAPVGPSLRQYANGAAVVSTDAEPRAVLDTLQTIEAQLGRRRYGQRWRGRVLDLDIVLWSGGAWADDGLVIPHRRFRERSFVLGPAARIAPQWCDPVTGFTVRQLHARLTRARATPR